VLPFRVPGQAYIVPLIVFLINVGIAGRLFTVEYTQHMSSIEGAYISIGRVLIDHWHELGWWPLWYLGIPWQNSYPPVLHVIVAGYASLFGVSTGLAHHAVTAFFYCLGPVSLLLLVLRLSRRWDMAGAAALAYSLLSPSICLISDVRHDVPDLFFPRRLQALVVYGEGPHITSMALFPLAVLLLDLALDRRRPLYILLSAVAMAAVVLTNWLGGFALAAAVVALLFARDYGWRARLAAIGIGLYAYLLASPWIPPSTLLAIRTNAQRVGGAYGLGPQHLLYLAIAAAVFAAVAYLLRHGGTPLRFSALFLLLMGGVTLAAEYFGIAMLPQPERYHLEMEMGVALLAGLGFGVLIERVPHRVPVLAAALLVTLAAAMHYRAAAREMIQPIDITTTIEYRMARWFDENMNGRRVMAPGTVSFWMNTWTDTPQLMGGFEQGITNKVLPAAHFQILSGMGSGEDAQDVAVGWLRVYGVHAVAVGGKNSREYYKPYTDPGRFEGLPELWREGDDVIYRLRQREDTLAWVMRPEDLVRKPVEYANYVAALQPYLGALETAAPARWRSNGWGRATAEAVFSPGQILSVQISHHPGWEARVRGKAVRIGADELGLMYVEPNCEGACTLELEFTGGLEGKLAGAVSAGSLLGGVVFLVIRRMLKNGKDV
jgi:hypothetical protein